MWGHCLVLVTVPSLFTLTCSCLHRDGPALEVGDLYWALKESVGKYELLLLRAVKFNLHIKLPHPVSPPRCTNCQCDNVFVRAVSPALPSGTVKVGGPGGVAQDPRDQTLLGAAARQLPQQPMRA